MKYKNRLVEDLAKGYPSLALRVREVNAHDKGLNLDLRLSKNINSLASLILSLFIVPFAACICFICTYQLVKKENNTTVWWILALVIDFFYVAYSSVIMVSLLLGDFNFSNLIFCYLGFLFFNCLYLLNYFLRYSIFIFVGTYDKQLSLLVTMCLIVASVLMLSMFNFIIYDVFFCQTSLKLVDFNLGYATFYLPLLAHNVIFVFSLYKYKEGGF